MNEFGDRIFNLQSKIEMSKKIKYLSIFLLLIGFALETDNEFGNATEKCKRKNFDFIVLNSLRDKNAGFQYDTNKITIIDKFGTSTSYDLKPKSEVAKDILDYATQLL